MTGQGDAPVALLAVKRPGTHCTGGWVWLGRENIAPSRGVRSRDRLACSESPNRPLVFQEENRSTIGIQAVLCQYETEVNEPTAYTCFSFLDTFPKIFNFRNNPPPFPPPKIRTDLHSFLMSQVT